MNQPTNNNDTKPPSEKVREIDRELLSMFHNPNNNWKEEFAKYVALKVNYEQIRTR